MSTLLYRWGKSAFAHPFRFLGAWLVLLAVILGSVAVNAPKVSNEVTIDGVESMRIIDRLEREMPAAAGDSGQIIYRAPEGSTFFDEPLAGALGQSVQSIYADDEVVDPAELAGSADDPAAQAQAAEMVQAAEAAAAAVRAGRTLRCLVQVSLDENASPEERGRGGAHPGDVPELADEIAGADGLELGGVMAVAPLGADPLPAFERLAGIAAEVRRNHPGASIVSAGMSGDLEQAIACGATHLRVGTALLGGRRAIVR